MKSLASSLQIRPYLESDEPDVIALWTDVFGYGYAVEERISMGKILETN